MGYVDDLLSRARAPASTGAAPSIPQRLQDFLATLLGTHGPARAAPSGGMSPYGPYAGVYRLPPASAPATGWRGLLQRLPDELGAVAPPPQQPPPPPQPGTPGQPVQYSPDELPGLAARLNLLWRTKQ